MDILDPISFLLKDSSGQARWLMPVIPALWGGRDGQITRSGVGDHSKNTSLLKIQKLAGTLGGQGGQITLGQEFKTSLANMAKSPSLLKIQKLARCGGLKSQLLGRLRQENHLNPRDGGCNEPRSRHCTPAWATSLANSFELEASDSRSLDGGQPAWVEAGQAAAASSLQRRPRQQCPWLHLCSCGPSIAQQRGVLPTCVLGEDEITAKTEDAFDSANPLQDMHMKKTFKVIHYNMVYRSKM
ncbi:hypothetical protein AAY473_030300 [Plecturocebus cupreus]